MMFKKSAVVLLSLCLISPLAFAVDLQDSTISVDYSMNKTVAPDTVTIRFYVENSGMNISDIKDKNDKIVNEAISKIKSNLSSNEQVKTISYRVNSVYSYKEKIRIFQKYEVTNGFEVKLKDMTKISKIIKIATDSGVKRVDNLNFTLENTQSECNKLLTEAANGAKNRASVVANALGTSVLKVKNANPYCSTSSSQPRYFNSMKALGATDSASQEENVLDVIEPGEINLRANMNVTYYLK